MEVGRPAKLRALIIIQARMKSSRLPGKVLMPIPLVTGKPIIKWIVDGIKLPECQTKIVVATSLNDENDVLEEYCNNNSITCFRGDEDDVLSRFIQIVKQNPCDVVVRLTGDNPIIDSRFLQEALDLHFAHGNEYSRTKSLPLGMNFELIAPHVLLEIELETLSEYDVEHVTPFIIRSGKIRKEVLKLSIPIELQSLRLTIDYPSDYLVISTILIYSQKYSLFGIELIERIFAEHRWIFDANKENIQKVEHRTLQEELSAALVILERFELKKAINFINSRVAND